MALKNSLDATQILPLTRLDHCCAQSDDETRIQFCIQRLMSFDKLNRKFKSTGSVLRQTGSDETIKNRRRKRHENW